MNNAASKQKIDLDNVTFGVITALAEEYIACKEIFDPENTGEEIQRKATSGMFRCWLCCIKSTKGNGSHYIAITLLPKMGNNASGIAANILLQHCKNTRYLIMCGIAGAVPNPKKAEDHVRLGDIVVSDGKGVIQYDLGKQRDPYTDKSKQISSTSSSLDDPLAGFEFRSNTIPPCAELLHAVHMLHAEEMLLDPNDVREWEKKTTRFLHDCGNQKGWKRPKCKKDILNDSRNSEEPPISHPPDNNRRKRFPRVFLGPIGSANIVLADPTRRDALRELHKVKAIEMEGSGVADVSWLSRVGYLVVRGTCDYCNSTKNDVWRNYASLIAACYAKTVIEFMHPVYPQDAVLLDTAEKLQLPSSPTKPYTQMTNDNPGQMPIGLSKSSFAKKPSTSKSVEQTLPPTSINFAADEGEEIPPNCYSNLAPLPSEFSTIMKQMEKLIREYRWFEAESLEKKFESHLRLLSAASSEFRQGLLILAGLETHRLQIDKQNGVEIDTSRLKSLREEAENVTE